MSRKRTSTVLFGAAVFLWILPAAAFAKTDGTALSAGPVNLKSVSALWGGPSAEVPKLTRLKYGAHAKEYCTRDWSKILAAKIRVKPLTPSLADFEASARKAGLSVIKLHKALATFLENQDKIPNQDHLSVVDFDKRSDEDRLFVVDLRTAKIEKYKTSGGKGSDPSSSGYSTLFSNRWDPSERTHTYASSLGCYLTESRKTTERAPRQGNHAGATLIGFRTGKGGRPTMLLHGFEPTNDNACNREVFLHVDESRPSYVGHLPGRSWGCFAIKPEDSVPLFTELSGGALLCAYREGKFAEAGVMRPQAQRTERKTPPPANRKSDG